MASETQEYRDRLFCFIFGSEAHRDWTLSLYNAVNGSHYTDPEAITIATLTQVVYMGMHNDVAFLIADEMNLYEQQSTINPNMPLRLMQYTGNLYEKLIVQQKKNKFGRALIQLPVPKLVVFYNGDETAPEETTLRLSDAFPEHRREDADISVRVRMVNINRGQNTWLTDACKPLNEYTWFVNRVRDNQSIMPLGPAIDAALDDMPLDYLIKPFLDANRVEVKTMLLTEYDEARTMEMFKEEGRVEGRIEGRAEGRAEGRVEGRVEGRAEGENKVLTLISRLIAAGRSGDIDSAVSDQTYRERLYREFGMA